MMDGTTLHSGPRYFEIVDGGQAGMQEEAL